jgi:hypothetical protein
MPPSVRVIGRIDRAEQVREAVRSAGFDAEVVTASPMSVFIGTPPGEGVDVAIATSIFDPPLWRTGKRRHPLRPMVVVAEKRHERGLRGAILRKYGPDAYVTWPATPEVLADAIRRAESTAPRARSWSAADVGGWLVQIGVFTGFAGGAPGALGALVAGVGFLLGLRAAWNLWWQAVGAVLFTLLGAVGVAEHLARWLG